MKFTYLKLLLLMLLAFVSCLATADQTFRPDASVQKVAEAYAQDAVDFSAEHFGVKLDWSDSSVASVEKLLTQMSASYLSANPRPSGEQVMNFAKAYGSYVGEVYRRNHGGDWGIITLGEQKFPGVRAASGTEFWPWKRAFDRITKGPEDNIADYYDALLQHKGE